MAGYADLVREQRRCPSGVPEDDWAARARAIRDRVQCLRRVDAVHSDAFGAGEQLLSLDSAPGRAGVSSADVTVDDGGGRAADGQAGDVGDAADQPLDL